MNCLDERVLGLEGCTPLAMWRCLWSTRSTEEAEKEGELVPAAAGASPASPSAAPATAGAAADGSAAGDAGPARPGSDGAAEAAVAPSAGAGRGAQYISRSALGPPQSLMDDGLPEWAFELDAGKWKAYPLQESLELDRYWQVFQRRRSSEGSWPQLASVRLMKREGVVDFVEMTCQVGGGRPRKLQRNIHDPGWLSNTFFFQAFKDALKRAGVSVESSAEEMFVFQFNQDFRGMRDDGRQLVRGGQRYELPIGWKRFAVNVKGQYDDGNNDWLREDETGWAVAYHGTSGDSLPGILCSGFHVGDRQKFEKDTGAGIYCTQWIDVAQHYSKPQRLEGHWVQIVLQLRVKPSAIRPVTDAKATDFERKYWVVNDPSEIRAYGVLIREFSLAEYIPPEVMVFGRDHPTVCQILEDLQKEAAAQ
mmetsp:Transcript_83943/g.271239  ORF Transcript_83943/g.271239 Transcript_83943/m.271239 type:complete len:421 (-) Transcript_83943:48-1310(-)